MKKLERTFPLWDDVTKEREFGAITAFFRSVNGHDGETDHNSENNNDDGDDLNHLVRVHEVIREPDSRLYFVMEYMKDGNLGDYLSAKLRERTMTNGPKEEDESVIRSILFQTLRGLSCVHSRGYVHRDVKPENILLHGRVFKLADFSLIRRVVGQREEEEEEEVGRGAGARTDAANRRGKIGRAHV